MSAFTVDGIHGTVTGEGPPVLLLHGIPETHLMWEQVTPALASRCTVVATGPAGLRRQPCAAVGAGPRAVRDADPRRRAGRRHGRALSCGHFLPEEAPAETAEALLEFLA